ncbi:T3SS effector HopA1 family protein [Actinacidiphila sp. bgisy167]|uniref:T3SS effector HopA1 family protein n=1 Tax=Actinacidiphila sp. bgisy167 TaxID=3413797 RepID=UPI003D71F680
MPTTLNLAARVAGLLDEVKVFDGGHRAETGGEVYESSSPQALISQLASVLYQTLHTGRSTPLEATPRTWRDAAFDARLSQVLEGRTLTREATVVGSGAEHTTVILDGLRVSVPSSSLCEGGQTTAQVLVPAARPGLSPGFFLAGSQAPTGTGPSLRLYAHLTDPEAAVPVWRETVGFLDRARTPWRAKISSSPLLYPRTDALVIYLPRPGWKRARACAEHLQSTGLLASGTSPFARPLTESVACAFEPNDQRPARRGMSFGQHRTHVLAEALVRHATLPPGSTESLEECLVAAFIDADIDPAEPARNLSSPLVDVLPTF